MLLHSLEEHIKPGIPGGWLTGEEFAQANKTGEHYYPPAKPKDNRLATSNPPPAPADIPAALLRIETQLTRLLALQNAIRAEFRSDSFDLRRALLSAMQEIRQQLAAINTPASPATRDVAAAAQAADK